MWGKYFSGREEKNFYLPGQEIKIDKSFSLKIILVRKIRFPPAKPRRLCNADVSVGLRRYRRPALQRLHHAKRRRNQDRRRKRHHPRLCRKPDKTRRHSRPQRHNYRHVASHRQPIRQSKKILNAQKAAAELSRILPDIRYEDILAKLQRRGSFVYIKRNLSPAQQYQINYLGIPGLEFEDGEKRIYPHKNLFAHLLGNTNIDNKGISGIEKKLDERLTQSDIPLQLTIDAGIQDTIRSELATAVEKYNAEGAAAILMDVKSGEIISMISLPDYDPNLNDYKTPRAQFNFATKGVYEPGSVLKIFNAALGLESGKVKLADRFDATKPLKLRYNTIKDYRGENRWLTLQEVLIYSSNIGSAQIALKVGKKNSRIF